VLKNHAAVFIKKKNHLLAAAALKRFQEVMEEIIPCSEWNAAVCRDIFYHKLVTMQFLEQRVSAEFCKSLLSWHLSYGGGVEVCRLFNQKVFPARLLKGATAKWQEMQPALERLSGERDRISSPAPTQSNTSGTIQGAIVNTHGYTCQPETKRHDTADRVPHAAAEHEDSPLSRRSDAASADAHVVSSGIELTITVVLPGLTSARDALVDVSETKVSIKSAIVEFPYLVDVPLPQRVNPSICAAKWSKRNHTLTISLSAAMDSMD